MEELLTELGVEWEATGPRSWVVTLPGTRKLKTLCNIVAEKHAVRLEAFVVRAPEENHARLWEMLLRRNAGMYGVAFTIDDHGDVYLMGRVPAAAIDAAELDRLLGCVLTYADDVFNTALEIGFASSITREWRWRVSRGEPTGNLAAFEHLRPDDDL